MCPTSLNGRFLKKYIFLFVWKTLRSVKIRYHEHEYCDQQNANSEEYFSL